MSANTNFAIAVHALSVLAYTAKLTTSAQISKSIKTNPVVIRRVMARLVKAGLATSTPGKAGGFGLAQAPQAILLVDVLRAVDASGVFRIHGNDENPNCPISCNIKGALADVLSRADAAVERELAGMTLQDVVSAVQ